MNTIGKILVVLNFLFAVIVGLLLVFVAALGNNWKDAYYSAEREAKVLIAERAATKKVMEKILNDYTRGQREYADLIGKLKKTEEDAKTMEDLYITQKEELKNQLKEAQITMNHIKTGNGRLTKEVADLNATIADRQTIIVRLQADIKRYRTEAVQFESRARALQTQNENLLEQLRDTTRQLALKDAGLNVEAIRVRNPNEPNPPAAKVEGKIEKVSDDLVQITLGTDHGVNKDNTLDVYRLGPEPKYLGMVRIVDANLHKSVARLVVTGNGGSRTPLRAGDLVSSKLTK